jgi:hypothetical protein
VSFSDSKRSRGHIPIFFSAIPTSPARAAKTNLLLDLADYSRSYSSLVILSFMRPLFTARLVLTPSPPQRAKCMRDGPPGPHVCFVFYHLTMKCDQASGQSSKNPLDLAAGLCHAYTYGCASLRQPPITLPGAHDRPLNSPALHRSQTKRHSLRLQSSSRAQFSYRACFFSYTTTRYTFEPGVKSKVRNPP